MIEGFQQRYVAAERALKAFKEVMDAMNYTSTVVPSSIVNGESASGSATAAHHLNQADIQNPATATLAGASRNLAPVNEISCKDLCASINSLLPKENAEAMRYTVASMILKHYTGEELPTLREVTEHQIQYRAAVRTPEKLASTEEQPAKGVQLAERSDSIPANSPDVVPSTQTNSNSHTEPMLSSSTLDIDADHLTADETNEQDSEIPDSMMVATAHILAEQSRTHRLDSTGVQQKSPATTATPGSTTETPTAREILGERAAASTKVQKRKEEQLLSKDKGKRPRQETARTQKTTSGSATERRAGGTSTSTSMPSAQYFERMISSLMNGSARSDAGLDGITSE